MKKRLPQQYHPSKIHSELSQPKCPVRVSVHFAGCCHLLAEWGPPEHDHYFHPFQPESQLNLPNFYLWHQAGPNPFLHSSKIEPSSSALPLLWNVQKWQVVPRGTQRTCVWVCAPQNITKWHNLWVNFSISIVLVLISDLVHGDRPTPLSTHFRGSSSSSSVLNPTPTLKIPS